MAEDAAPRRSLVGKEKEIVMEKEMEELMM
jgi:hypothetical protein